MLSDSDAEDEGDESLAPATGLHLTTTTSHVSDTGAPSRGPSPPASAPHSNDGDHDDESQAGDHPVNRHGAGAAAEGHADEAMEDVGENTPSSKRQSASGTTAVTPPARHTEGGPVLGPKKVKVVINDAAWSTWWALLYWVCCVDRLGIALTIRSTPIRSTLRPSLRPSQSALLRVSSRMLGSDRLLPSRRQPTRLIVANGSNNGSKSITLATVTPESPLARDLSVPRRCTAWRTNSTCNRSSSERFSTSAPS
jgi:hypothetical protein